MMYSLTASTLVPGQPFVTLRTTIRPRLTVARIQEVVARYYCIQSTEMTSARRARLVARPRQVAMYLTRELTPKSLPDIGRRFGGRDHTTVIHAMKTIERLKQIDGELADDIDTLRERLAA